MPIRWTKKALSQLDAAHAFISRDSLQAANRQIETILDSVERLTYFPELGRPGRVAGTREWFIQGTPYTVTYRYLEETVRVVAVLHGARLRPGDFN